MPRMASLPAVCIPLLLLTPALANGHGGVVLDEDVCLINVGFYQAHFTVFQPLSRQHEQYCEDLPDTGESIFVLEYLHDGLSDLGVDFRIINNTTGMGRFATLEDIADINDLSAATVYYQPPVYEPDVFAVLHQFDAPGEFIGVVTAHHADGKQYTAVFPFEVGFELNDYADYAIYVIGLLALLGWVGPLLRRKLGNRPTSMHYKGTSGGFGLLLLTLCAATGGLDTSLAQAEAQTDAPAPTEDAQAAAPATTTVTGERYQLRLTPLLSPLKINVMHSWRLQLATRDGAPISGANISVGGGMPAHDHGLPTAPRVQATDTVGEYLLHGVKFHMRGAWELLLTVTQANDSETLTVNLDM